MFNINYTTMKKLIIILLLLITGNCFAQIDTATWSIQRDGLGYYSVLTNRVTVGGVVAGGIRTPLIMSIAEIDTTNYQLIRDGLGYYSAAISKADMYGIDSGKIRVTISYSVNPFSVAEAHTWTSPQIFQSGAIFQGMTYIDSLTLRMYFLDTGTTITRNLIPQTTRLYNLGGSSNYWLNTYTQNLYADTIRLGTSNIQKGDGFIRTNNNLYLLDTKDLDWGAGNARITGKGFNTVFSNWDGSIVDTTMILNGTDSSATFFGTLYPSNNFSQNIGTETQFWLNAYIRYVKVDNIYPRTSSGVNIGSGINPVVLQGNTKITSLNIVIDSTGATVDSVYIGRHTIIVNCGAADSNVVWLSDYNVTAGQRYMVKKIDANATNVIVKSKSGYTIDGAISKIWNTQYQTYTFVYRNKTWYIL